MSSTNKTTHYNLSQYVASDKPTYLVDYNADMSAIDSGIYAAKSEADTNTVSIGTLSSLTTTEKSNLVGAINELDSDLGTLSGTVSQHTTDIAGNTSAIGNLANLTTTNKSNLVGAVNEVKGQINDFNLTSFVTPTLTVTKTADGSAAGITVNNNTIKIAKNSNGSLFKFYGSVQFVGQAYKGQLKYTFSNTGLPAIDEAYTISNAAIGFLNDSTFTNQRVRDIKYETNGDITMTYEVGAASSEFVYIPNCLYFNSNFGDLPTPE